MKTKIAYTLVALIFLSGLYLVTKALMPSSEDVVITNESDSLTTERLEATRKHDFEVLVEDADLDEAQIIKSLKRYTAQNLPESEGIITKYIDHKSTLVRAAALEAAGAYEWARIAWYKDALNSTNKVLRQSAIKGLQKRINDQRIYLLKSFIQKKLQEEDRVLAHLALIRQYPDNENRRKVLDQLLSYQDNWSPEVKLMAVTGIFRAFPRNDYARELAEVWVNSEQPAIASAAKNYLSRTH